MNKFVNKNGFVFFLCIVITLSTALLKYFFADRFFIAGGYLFAVLLTVFLNGRGYTWSFGAVSILLMTAAAFLPHRTLSRQALTAEALVSVSLLLLTVLFVLYVKKLHGSIEHEQQQMASMFEYATEGIVLTDGRGNITLINPAALQLFHYTKEELTGAPVETLIPGRFHMKHKHYREGFQNTPSNRTMGMGRELFARKKDGEEFPVEVSLSYYRSRNQLYVMAFVVDITERKKSEKQMIEQKLQLENISNTILKLNAELEQKVEQRTVGLTEALAQLEHSKKSLSDALEKEKELNEIKSRFVSMASHEFRTPLSTVLSSAALIGKYEKEEEQGKREKHVRRIMEAVKHLNDLLEDFLSLGKLEEGKVETIPDQLDIEGFIRDITEDMGVVCKTGQHIDVDYSGIEKFSTDKKLLRNILINLLSNAIKFSAEGTAIWLRIRQNREGLVIEVEDNGIGIPAQDLAYMFTSFYRGSNAVNIQGTGLGLHIVKRYVDLLKGKISIDSVFEKGTTVVLNIPQMHS
jgi:PAS domain S-box-containing protein